MKKRTWYHNSSFVIIVVCILSVVSVTDIFGVATGYGYGYGYGIETCTVAGPTGLTAAISRRFRLVRLQWESVDFSDCGSTTAKYHVEIWKGGVRRMDYTVAGKTSRLKFTDLFGTGFYEFRVQAEATDGQTSDWSTFRSFVL